MKNFNPIRAMFISLVMFVLLGYAAHGQAATLSPTVIPAGVVNDGAYPDYDFDYCNREAAKTGNCTVIDKDANWVAFWAPGDSSCEKGYYGYINTKTMKGYMIEASYTCSMPAMTIDLIPDENNPGHSLFVFRHQGDILYSEEMK